MVGSINRNAPLVTKFISCYFVFTVRTLLENVVTIKSAVYLYFDAAFAIHAQLVH